MNDCLHQFQTGRAIKRPLTGKRLEQRYAERKDVAARVEGLTGCLFRRHVSNSSDDDSGPCRRGLTGGLFLPHASQLRKTEIDKLGITILCHQNVCRLEISM